MVWFAAVFGVLGVIAGFAIGTADANLSLVSDKVVCDSFSTDCEPARENAPIGLAVALSALFQALIVAMAASYIEARTE